MNEVPVLRVIENDGTMHGILLAYVDVETWCGRRFARNDTSWSIDAVNCIACIAVGEEGEPPT